MVSLEETMETSDIVIHTEDNFDDEDNIGTDAMDTADNLFEVRLPGFQNWPKKAKDDYRDRKSSPKTFFGDNWIDWDRLKSAQARF